MDRNWSIIVLLLFVTCYSKTQNSSQSLGTGVIAGTVNEQGQLFDQANICVSTTSGGLRETNCNVRIEKDGRFQIDDLKFGTYEVFAINEQQGYSIDNQSPGRKITITSDHPWADVTIRLRPRGGILIGSVRDKISGQPVKGINAQYLVIDGKAAGGGGSALVDGEFRITVPTACDLVVVVSAPGYQGWVYTDPSNPARPVLRMSSGEPKELDIELEPLPNASTERRKSQSAEQPR
jgi:hypothetical protein